MAKAIEEQSKDVLEVKLSAVNGFLEIVQKKKRTHIKMDAIVKVWRGGNNVHNCKDRGVVRRRLFQDRCNDHHLHNRWQRVPFCSSSSTLLGCNF